MRPLFIIGNKRSGTSQLVRILNLHPNIFITHESDIVWILHQFHNGQPFSAHPWDSETGMKHTLAAAGHLLQRDKTPWENFQAVVKHLMEQGTPWLKPLDKPDLRWIGDKKPFQHIDPQLVPFILENFPDALFLHIVRHPCAVAASSDKFNESGIGDFWMDMSLEEKVERWAYNEKLVQAMQEKLKDRVHHLRYEDLCRRTEEELSAVFGFLGLTPDAKALKNAARKTVPANRAYPKISCSAETQQMARQHGYDLQNPTGRLRAFGGRLYWKLVKRLHLKHAS